MGTAGGFWSFFPKEELALPCVKFKNLLIPNPFWWLTKVTCMYDPPLSTTSRVPCCRNLRAFHFWTKMFEYMNISRYWMCRHWNKKMRTISMGYIFTFYSWSLNMEVPIIINHQIKSKKVNRKMKSNITKILIKKVLEKMGDSPLK